MSSLQPQPRITAFISLEPPAYSFSQSDAPPSLILTVKSFHSTPITIFCDDLQPTLLPRYGAFTMKDLVNGTEVAQTTQTHCRFEPPSRAEVRLNEDLFVTLYPQISVALAAPFTRNPKTRPIPSNVVDSAGPSTACGVDGLTPGHSYEISLSERPRIHWTSIRWWDYGTRDEILGRDLDKRRVKFRKGPHDPIEIDVSAIQPVVLVCQE